MHRYVVGVLCLLCVFSGASSGQSSGIPPLQVATGTVLSFHLQTRLNPNNENVADVLPKGTILQVKMLDSIDSKVNADGTHFRGEMVSSVTSGNQTIVHSDSEVRGILALLRSRSHPEGFRYELLITGVTDHGRSYDLTASLSPSFFETASEPVSVPISSTKAVASPKLIPAENIPSDRPR
jgi:hypothetical protein